MLVIACTTRNVTLCTDTGSLVFPAGVFRYYLKPTDKHHLTDKPVPLMAHLMEILPPSSVILDPFAGSGTMIAAARQQGHTAHGVELSPEYARIARGRLASLVD